MDWGGLLKSGLGALGGMFGFGGGGGNSSGNSLGGQTVSGISGIPMGGGNNSGGMSGFGSLFKNPNFTSGLAGMFGSQLIGNPKPPKLPDSFNQFQQQANAGGTPGMQAANQYYQGVLSGNNQNAYDASTHALDLNYQEQLRQLNGMYKSLRPGTDPTSDTTYQRDLANLNDQYARQKAQTHAQVQQGAAQGAGQLGVEQANQQMQAIETQVNMIAQQWGMSYAQREALRNQLMQQSGLMMGGPILQQIFSGMRG